MKKKSKSSSPRSKPLAKGKTNWARLLQMKEAEITANALADPDAQPTTAKDWENAVLVVPKQKSVYFPIDSDIYQWFNTHMKHQKLAVNAILKSYIDSHKYYAKNN